MVATAPPAPSSLAGPPAQGRSASRITSDRPGATWVSPENDVSEQLAHRCFDRAGGTCIGRARPHRSDAHQGRCRFSGQTRNGRYSWARYYHPGLQRFISEDLIGFAGGDVNLYAYVENSSMRLGDLAKLARDEHAAAGRGASPFLVTVFAGLEERWLRADSRARQMLARAGVDRQILLVSPPFDAGEIRAAGRLLGA